MPCATEYATVAPVDFAKARADEDVEFRERSRPSKRRPALFRSAPRRRRQPSGRVGSAFDSQIAARNRWLATVVASAPSTLARGRRKRSAAFVQKKLRPATN